MHTHVTNTVPGKQTGFVFIYISAVVLDNSFRGYIVVLHLTTSSQQQQQQQQELRLPEELVA